MRHLLRHLLLIAALTGICAAQATAQESARSMEEPYKYDLGLAMGLGGYWGDLSGNMFQSPGVAATAIFHYRFDTRWLLRASLTGTQLSGNNEKSTNVYPDGPYQFTAGFYTADVRGEFNFFNFGIGETYKRLRRWTPYLALGLGAALSVTDGHSSVAMTLPMAFGFRYKISERFNLGAEWTFTKVFGDKVDGLQDLTGISTNFLRQTDWVSTIQVYFTVEFGRRCTVCNRHD